jgi:hypothetical protein
MKKLFNKSSLELSTKKVLMLFVVILSCIITESFSIKPCGEFSSTANSQGDAPKVLTWGPQYSGNCVMDGASITFYPNGTGVFRSTVWTNHTHSGDTWHHTITVIDGNSSVLFTLYWDGPNHMNDDGSRYPFERSFSFDPNFFNIIYTAQASGSC